MYDIRVTPDGGEPFEIEATSRDVVVWEKTGRGRAAGQLAGERLTMTSMTEIAWVASRRLGKIGTEVPLAQFMQTVDIKLGHAADEDEETPVEVECPECGHRFEVQAEDDADAADPTQPAA